MTSKAQEHVLDAASNRERDADYADQRERVLALAARHGVRVQRAQYVDRRGDPDRTPPESWSVLSTNPASGAERVEARNLTLAHLEKKLRNW